MSRTSRVSFVALILFTVIPALARDEIDARIDAVEIVEATPREVVGAAGERSPWQIMPSVWAEFSSAPFWWASSPVREHRAETRAVARRYCQWIRKRLPGLGLEDTAYNVGLMWNAGYGRVRDGRTLPRHRDYAQRVQNVFDSRRR